MNFCFSRRLQWRRCMPVHRRAISAHFSNCCNAACCSAAAHKHLVKRISCGCLSDSKRTVHTHADEHATVRSHAEQQQRFARSDHSAAATASDVECEWLADRTLCGRRDEFSGWSSASIVRAFHRSGSGSEPRPGRRSNC